MSSTSVPATATDAQVLAAYLHPARVDELASAGHDTKPYREAYVAWRKISHKPEAPLKQQRRANLLREKRLLLAALAAARADAGQQHVQAAAEDGAAVEDELQGAEAELEEATHRVSAATCKVRSCR